MKIGLHGREIKEKSRAEVRGLFDELKNLKAEISISNSFYDLNHSNFDISGIHHYPNRLSNGDLDFVFSVGGDGTLLETITHVGESGIPVLGINTGRLGFLATTAKDEISAAVRGIETGDYELEPRSLIQLMTNNSPFGQLNFALNEFAILRKDSSSMITVKAFLDDEYLNTYWADGLMVSTPTGSTGYSLSCGGPILVPSSKNFIITPVSPHNLNIRPLVIPDTGKLKFQVDSRDSNALISLDSRSGTLQENAEIIIVKAPFNVMLVRLHGATFIETLRNKLGWGFDKRN